MLNEDIKRLVRHIVPVAVIFAVSKGWIPHEAQGDLIEAGIIIASVLFSVIWSAKRDRRK